MSAIEKEYEELDIISLKAYYKGIKFNIVSTSDRTDYKYFVDIMLYNIGEYNTLDECINRAKEYIEKEKL